MSIVEMYGGDVGLLVKCLADIGVKNFESIHWNLSSPQLYEAAIRRREARLAHLGPLVTRTGTFTGRAPNDKFIVDDEKTHDDIEPLIYQTTRMFGTILENVGVDTRHRRLDLNDARLTENTRASYPVTHIPNAGPVVS